MGVRNSCCCVRCTWAQCGQTDSSPPCITYRGTFDTLSDLACKLRHTALRSICQQRSQAGIPASLPAQLRRPSTTIKAITCQATIGSCHEAASLLMAYCDCLDGLAPPQGLHQIYIFLPCTSMQLLCMCVMCFSAQQISANADPPCLHFSCSLSASQLEGGMHVRIGRPLLHSDCWIPEEKALGNTLPGSAKMRVTPSFSRAATKRSEALVSCPISVMSTPSCTAVVHAIHG